jgi:hypothetical protein
MGAHPDGKDKEKGAQPPGKDISDEKVDDDAFAIHAPAHMSEMSS